MLQEGANALVPVPAHGRVLAAAQLHTGLSVYLVPPFNNRVVKGTESGTLNDAAYADKGKDERHEGEIRHLERARVRVSAAAVLAVPALPILPCGVVAGVASPSTVIIIPVAVVICRRGVVVACPAVAPCIICFAFLDIRQDIVRGYQHSIALQTHMERQTGHGGCGVASVGVVQLHECIEAVLGVGSTLGALQDLIWRRRLVRLDGFRPVQGVQIIAG